MTIDTVVEPRTDSGEETVDNDSRRVSGTAGSSFNVATIVALRGWTFLGLIVIWAVWTFRRESS
jgi:hypothetical protein